MKQASPLHISEQAREGVAEYLHRVFVVLARAGPLRPRGLPAGPRPRLGPCR